MDTKTDKVSESIEIDLGWTGTTKGMAYVVTCPECGEDFRLYKGGGGCSVCDSEYVLDTVVAKVKVV